MTMMGGLLLAINLLAAQDSQETSAPAGSREMVNVKFLQMRKSPPAQPGDKKLDDSFVGFTVWRLRPSKASDDKNTRMLVQGDAGNEEFTPERYDVDSPLPKGEKVRLSIETARTGYLYVVDREQYEGGVYGDAMLIFPTTMTRGGDNHVRAGTVIEIPSPDDPKPYFSVVRSRPDHLRDVLTVLVTPEPIAGITIGRKALKLTPEQFTEWEKKWATQVKRIGTAQGTGQAYTAAEKRAGQNLKPLSEKDPAPATIYNCDAKPGEPMLVNIPLKMGN
jgi:hypothetical protein